MVVFVWKSTAATAVKDLLRSLEYLQVQAVTAAIDADTRTLWSQQFGVGALDVLVTTEVTGAGIDWPHVRTAVHYGDVDSFVDLWQHLLRAGSFVLF